jgi:hypothetical protein
MSSSFNNFLSTHGSAIFKSYSHATRLYTDNKYARAPKLGFIYYVVFNIRNSVISDENPWATKGKKDVGLLVNKIDMPKFKITSETLNQYNRKTVIQSKLEYQPVSINFHDDNSEITNGLWKNYYKYYYADSLFGDKANGIRDGFQDTKYQLVDNAYGLSNQQQLPFFESIDIYVLHQGKFTEMQLINPLVTSWDHDSLDQSQGNKILNNKMTVVYENVIYKQGRIIESTNPPGFAAKYYDHIPGSISVAGNVANAILSSYGLSPGEEQIFGYTSNNNPNYVAPATQANPGPSQSQKDKAAVQAQGTYTGPTAGQISTTAPSPLGLTVKTPVQNTTNQTEAAPVNLAPK